jgi:hypothetical protein
LVIKHFEKKIIFMISEALASAALFGERERWFLAALVKLVPKIMKTWAIEIPRIPAQMSREILLTTPIMPQ